MKKAVKLTIYISILCLYSCTSGNKETQEETENSSKQASELTYGEIWSILLKDNDAGGMEPPEGPYSNEALGDVVEIMTSTCAQENCGYLMQLQNVSSGIITVVMKFSLNIPGNPIQEFVRAYDIGSMEKVNTGCTHFCYSGQSYSVSREIISSTYK